MDKVKLIKNVAFGTVFAVLVLLSVYMVIGTITQGTAIKYPTKGDNLTGTVELRINLTLRDIAANITNVSFWYNQTANASCADEGCTSSWVYIGDNSTFINYTLIRTETGNTSVNITVDWDTTSGVTDGRNFIIKALIYENGSEYTNSSFVNNVTIDNTAPATIVMRAYQYHESGYFQPTHYTNNGTGIRFNISATEALQNISTCLLYTNVSNTFGINATLIWPNMTAGPEEQFNITVDNRYMNISTDGGYIWNVKCNDTAGNAAFNNTNYTIIYDATVPTASLTVPSESTTFGDDVAITCVRADTTAGFNDTVLVITKPNANTVTHRDWNTSGNADFVILSGEGKDLDELGEYKVDCTVKDRAQNSVAASQKTFTVTTSGYGGGAGGGGRSYTWNPETQEEKTQLMSVNDKVVFTIAGVSHTATVTSVGTDSVTVKITSLPITVTVKVGETKKIDLEKDAVYDLAIELKNIIGSRANIEFTVISESYIPEKEEEEEEPTPTKKPVSTLVWWIIGIIALIIVIGIIYSATKKKKK